MSSTILGIIASSGGAAASTSSYESIASATGTGSAGNITFSSILGTYKHLQLRILSKDTVTTGSISDYKIIFNSDSTSGNYTRHDLTGNGTTASAFGSATAQTGITINTAIATSATGLTSMMGVALIDIVDYASSTKYKTVKTFSGVDLNTTATRISLNSGLWLSTAAITSITISPASTAFTTNSTFALYGIKG